jgi:hypothetical protein
MILHCKSLIFFNTFLVPNAQRRRNVESLNIQELILIEFPCLFLILLTCDSLIAVDWERQDNRHTHTHTFSLSLTFLMAFPCISISMLSLWYFWYTQFMKEMSETVALNMHICHRSFWLFTVHSPGVATDWRTWLIWKESRIYLLGILCGNANKAVCITVTRSLRNRYWQEFCPSRLIRMQEIKQFHRVFRNMLKVTYVPF